MLMNDVRISYGCSRYFRQIAYLIFMAVILLPLVGCGSNGDGGPAVSSLSTTTDETEDTTSDVDTDPNLANLAAEEPPANSMLAMAEEDDADVSGGLAPDSPESNSDGEDETAVPPPLPPTGNPVIAMASTPTGATANVTWQQAPDSSVKGYYIYYGKQSSGEPGVCTYEERHAVDDPSVTLTELEPNTPYFFAVSSYAILESPCSIEVTAITPPAQA